MSETAAELGDILLSCQPGREGDQLVFDYVVTNHHAVAVYVMDALSGSDPATGRPALDRDAVSVWLAADAHVQILRGVPAMPDGHDPEQRIVPLAVRLPPGQTLARRAVQPHPLVEHSAYTPPGHLHDYRLVPIQGVAMCVDVIAADRPGFSAVKAAGHPPGYFRLVPEDDVLNLRRLSCGFRARGLHALIHKGAYARPAEA